jgi:hypothetical protein
LHSKSHLSFKCSIFPDPVSFSIKWIKLHYRACPCPSHSLHNLLPFIKIVRGTIPNNYVIINKNESSLFLYSSSLLQNLQSSIHQLQITHLNFFWPPDGTQILLAPWRHSTFSGPRRPPHSLGPKTASSTHFHLAQRRPPQLIFTWPNHGLLNSSSLGILGRSVIERIKFTHLNVSSPLIHINI